MPAEDRLHETENCLHDEMIYILGNKNKKPHNDVWALGRLVYSTRFGCKKNATEAFFSMGVLFEQRERLVLGELVLDSEIGQV